MRHVSRSVTSAAPRAASSTSATAGSGHASHQNGRDIDFYYPRLDGEERAPTKPSEVDRVLAQDLVNRFVRAGATNIFVGPRLAAARPAPDRRAAPAPRRPHARSHPSRSGSGADARAIDSRAADRGCAGRRSDCAAAHPRHRLHPWRRVRRSRSDAAARASRAGRRRVDRSPPEPGRVRARPAAERARRRPEPQLRLGMEADRPPLVAGVLGPRPFSERESRIARRLITGLQPDVTIWFHQPQALVRAWGPSIERPVNTRVSPACGSRPSGGRQGPRRTGRTIASRGSLRTSSSFRLGRSARAVRSGMPRRSSD